jgi:phosphoesterase RecJ-like protein
MRATEVNKNIPSSIITEIQTHHRFLIGSHINPDGDAIGSQLALAIFLIRMGKDVVVFNRDKVPEIYRFLPHSEHIVHDLQDSVDFDCTFILDCSTFKRVSEDFDEISKKGKVIVIDHHLTTEGDGEINLIVPEACATGELIYRLIQKFNDPMTPEIAINLYTAILTDTGSFQFSNATAEAFYIAGDLVDGGVDPRYVAEKVYESYSMERFRLLAKVLQTLEVNNGKNIGLLTATRPMLQEAQATAEMTDGFANIPRSIRGVEVAALFREVSDRLYKVSLRSKKDIDVARVAFKFDGGGHFNAAGCLVKGDLQEVKQSVLAALQEGINDR